MSATSSLGDRTATTEPWQMLGFLGARLDAFGSITPEDWAQALEAAQKSEPKPPA